MRTLQVALLLIVSGCASPVDALDDPTDTDVQAPQSAIGSPEVRVFGSLRQIFTDGDFSATVSLQDQGIGPNAVGLGSLSGLRGEIAIVGGEAWLAYPDGEDAVSVSHSNAPSEEAALLVVSDVPEWVGFTLDEDTSYDALADTIAALLSDADWPDTGAVPFTIEGPIKRVDWHVIDGSRLPEGQQSHEDQDNASVTGSLTQGSPLLVGFYSTQHAGVFTHGGLRLHLHVIDADRSFTAHVEDALVGAGSVVSFPAP